MSRRQHSETFYVWTDGGCKPNPGAGGWGALIRNDHGEEELYGGEHNTTNNRMEMTAAISALEFLPTGSEVILRTDSEYLRNGITRWIHGWKRRNWMTATGSPVANIDLWQRLDDAIAHHRVHWEWVKGHAGIPENERCDQLATLGRNELRR